jgi:glycosyltransferase involved in cell wall biosynthesis
VSTKLPISVTIITLNEEARIGDAIRSVLSFASEVVVVDSESVDRTIEIAKSLGAQTFIRRFDGFGQQKNFAHQQATQEWVLSLDADERVSSDLALELSETLQSVSSSEYYGFSIPRKTWYLNRWIKHGGWYPDRHVRLARRKKSRWSEPSLHEALVVEGKVCRLQQPIEHYSFPNQNFHVMKNLSYARLAKHDLSKRRKTAHWFDFTARPFYRFIDGYFFKRGFLDGMPGFLIAFHSAYALFLRYAYLYEEQYGQIVKNLDC